MSDAVPATTRASDPHGSAPPGLSAPSLEPVLQGLRDRLESLGLTASLWDPAGNVLVEPTPRHELCRYFCSEKHLCQETMSLLAQKACSEDSTETTIGPTGCRILAVPLHQRRRRVGAAVACMPTRQTPRTDQFARTCSQLGLDQEFAAGLCRRAARHDEAEAETLCQVLKWLIDDAQAKIVAREELTTLSANLANTYEELSLLYRISGSMKVTRTPAEFFENLCRELLEVMQLQAVAVVLHPREHESDGEQVVTAGQPPVGPEQLTQIALRYLAPRLSGGAGQAGLASGARALIENHFAENAGHLGPKAAGIHTLIAVPLMSAENRRGILLGLNKLPGDFDSTDLKLISSIGSQAGAFLENYHLYEELQDLVMGVLHSLIASIDAKDPYTSGHSRRVAEISKRLAVLSGFDARRAERVYLAGLLHDIGKIGMPENVLHKAGRLTDEEYAEVKCHPEVGAAILSGIRQTGDVLPGIRYHHERPDGRGYPKGLAGKEIPIEALIVGLADGFDAMTSCRTYRQAMPLEAVLAEIRRCSGTQFDPRLVELLLSIDLEAFLVELRNIDRQVEQMFTRS